MECSREELERKERLLLREAVAATAAGDSETAKRILEGGLADIEMKRRRLEQPAAQAVA